MNRLGPGQWAINTYNSHDKNQYGSLLNQHHHVLNNATGNAALNNSLQSLLVNTYNTARHIAPTPRLPSRTEVISQMGFSGHRRPVRNRIIAR